MGGEGEREEEREGEKGVKRARELLKVNPSCFFVKVTHFP